MIKRIVIALLIPVLLNSCVSAKVFKELEDKYADLKSDHEALIDNYAALEAEKNKLQNEFSALEKLYAETEEKKNKLERDYIGLQSKYDKLNDSYVALEKNSSASIAANVKKNRELLAQLEAKEAALAAENARLEKLQKELNTRSNRINELESVIASKDAAMKKLKDAISRALLDFEGKGLTVEQRDGKVYVSMENKLLFQSGSWAVGTEGQRAVNALGTVLAKNPDISVLIEGHTDNAPYSGNGNIKDNWDLSTKRATSIVAILRQNGQIKPENLTAAGRGEYSPIAPNSSAEGKSKNRRIEVILTPKLDEVTKLLNEVE
ncbi:OmpA family protein [Spongiivirga sp. MCCC 1A20706]|uniref:OmpA family protein n=1 Tax=Spongiivirga sp. MCCC 1A20706 TaxID=3160963 RepID=UPI0039777439